MKNAIKLLIIIRHGERTDRVGEIPKCGTLNPELTEKGKQQSFLAGKLTINAIEKYGFKNINPNMIEIRSSPYMRTIQTSSEIIKVFNLFFKEKNIEEKLNKIYIDFDLKKRIVPTKKIDKKEFLYRTTESYINFDQDLKEIEFLGDKGEFSLETETKEKCEQRSFNYYDNVLKKAVEKNKENKIFIIVGHRGCLKHILKKLGYNLINKNMLDYCSQFFFDVSKGLDQAKFLENLGKPNF